MEYLPGGGQMKAADQYTIQTLGVPSLELMERAAGECVRFFEEAGLDLSRVCVSCAVPEITAETVLPSGGSCWEKAGRLPF